ncbi:hypothetical protein KIV56_17450 [Cryobacterium breve]|uniref:Uncharacterized protein n=1 Tax=Cryobacterium breve TaxID=1259258 RepID=A0ABY7NBP1_9MICO|nr:hypothetical protein [Cryobacterium breve]WBM79923.1 hypothetical protein KIV56_17450 [Cryobacterium breve]
MLMRARIHTGLVWVMVLVLAASVVGLAVHWAGWGPAGEVWFEPAVVVSLGLTDLLPVAVCWMAVGRVGLRRPEVLLAATAMTAYIAGDSYRAWVEATTGSIPFPSVGDILYSLFYLLMLAALIVAVRRHVRTLASSVWLDCVVGSLGAAAVLAIPLSPVLDSALTGSSWLATVTAISFPLFDLLLVAAIGGIGALGEGGWDADGCCCSWVCWSLPRRTWSTRCR